MISIIMLVMVLLLLMLLIATTTIMITEYNKIVVRSRFYETTIACGYRIGLFSQSDYYFFPSKLTQES